jgi:hypothetical protein
MTTSVPDFPFERPLAALGVDVAADQALLSSHHLPKLQARLQQALRRRAFAWGVSVGVSAALMVCAGLWGALTNVPVAKVGSAAVTAPSPPATPVLKAEAPVINRPNAAAICPPSLVTQTLPKPPTPAVARTAAVSTSTDKKPQTIAPSASDPFAASRLRKLLTLYALAEDALRTGDIARASDLVAQADAMAAGGPIGAEFAALKEQIEQAGLAAPGEEP